MTEHRRGRVRRPPVKRKGSVSSAVVAAATVGVTGLSLSWALRTSTPVSASTVVSSKAEQARQMAADEAAIAQLRTSISATKQQIAALNTPVGTTTVTSVPGAPAGTQVTPSGGQYGGSTSSGTGTSQGPGSAPVQSQSAGAAPAAASAPAPVSSAPAPTAAAPPPVAAPAPPPVAAAPPPPPVAAPPPVKATTGASPAKP